MAKKILFIFIFAFLESVSFAATDYFEITGGFFYSRSNYSDDNYTWSRRWTGGVGYHFTPMTEIEVSYQQATTRVYVLNYQDTVFNDEVYSVDWVQQLVPTDWPILPFVKGGIGQLNRNASGSYGGGGSPPSILDSLTGILGVGTRVQISQHFGLRGEITSYLTGAQIQTWQKNIGATAGFSLYF